MFTRVDSQQEGVLAWPCKELLSSAFKPVAMASYSLRDSLNLQMSNSRSPCMTPENGPDGPPPKNQHDVLPSHSQQVGINCLGRFHVSIYFEEMKLT